MWKQQTAIAAAILALSGCAAIQGQMAADSEQILAEAGFRKEPVSSAAQGASKALPARQLTAATEDGSSVYEFYDPQFCNCVYVGGAQDYARLQQLRSARVAEHEQLQMGASGITAPDPRLWGPWRPVGLEAK